MEDIEELKALCSKYWYMEVSREDFHAAGNCTFCIAAFFYNHFPGCQKVVVAELSRYISNGLVQAVLRYMLLPLAKTDSEKE